MATYSRVKTFVANETLTASDLNTEFNNIITNTNSGNLNSDNVSTSAAWTWTGYHTYSTSSRIVLADNIFMTLGNATDGDYRLRYNSSSTALELTSTNSDGSGTDAVVMDVQDGTDDVRIRGGLSTNNNAAPTSGIVTGGNIVSDTDSTDDLGTTSVRWANLYVDAATITNNLTVGGTLTLTGGLTLNGNVTVGDNASDTLTINSTITSNLIFTDATYDIGASGATRPRDLHLSRNALMGGTLGVTGLLTATGGVTSGSNIVSDTDSTDDLGTTSVRWANLYVDSIGDSGQALAVKATTLSFDAASTIDTSGNNNLTLDAGTATLTLDAATIESDASTLSFDAAASIDTSGNNNLSLDAGTATLTLDAGTIESDAGTLSFDAAASIDTSGNNALAIDTGSANLNVTAGTLALTGAQTISSTLGVSDNVAISKTGGADTELSIYNGSSSASAKASLKVGFDSSNHLHIYRAGNAAGIVYNATQSGSSHQFQIAGSAKATLDATGNLLVGGTSQSGTANRAAVFSGNKFGLSIIDTTAQAAGVGGALNLGGNYRSAGDAQAFSRVEAVKENATDANYAYGMAFSTTANGGTFAEAMRISSTGDLLVGTTSDQIARVFATTGTSGDFAGYFKNTVNNRGPFFVENTNASLNDCMHRMSASAAYNGSSAPFSFMVCTSSIASSADTEFLMRGDGEAYADGAWNNSGADYQEYFESDTGSAAEVGRTIVLDGDKVRYYNADTDSTDDIMGVTRPQADNKNSAVVGNVAWNHWTDKYLTDDWGVYLREDVTVWTYTDEKGDEHTVHERAEIAKDADWTPPSGATSSTQSVRKLNPDFNESLDENYESREVRDEWWLIGLLGQIQVKAGEPTNPRWIKMKNISDAVELYYVR